MSTATVNERIADAEAVARAELEQLAERRGPLALDALSGDESARAELADIAERTLELERVLDSVQLASAEAERREQEAVAAAEATELERREREHVRLTCERAAALQDLQRSAIQTGEVATRFLALDATVFDSAGGLGRSTRGLASVAASLITIRLRDSAPGLPDLGSVTNFHRKQLLELYPLDEPEADRLAELAVSNGGHRSCSVCSSPELAEIEAALEAGVPLREAAETFSVSRSALSRHRQHGA